MDSLKSGWGFEVTHVTPVPDPQKMVGDPRASRTSGAVRRLSLGLWDVDGGRPLQVCPVCGCRGWGLPCQIMGGKIDKIAGQTRKNNYHHNNNNDNTDNNGNNDNNNID